MKLAALIATVFAVLLGVGVPSAGAAAPQAPDIEMQPPMDLSVTSDDPNTPTHWYLAFGAKVINNGPGPLKVVGSRANTLDPTMDATQLLLDDPSVHNGKPVRTKAVGEMEFSPSLDHDHWHYLRFEDYNLLTVPDLLQAAPTRKTGFCLLGLDLDFWCGHEEDELLAIGNSLDMTDANADSKAMGIVVQGGGDTYEYVNGVRTQVRSSEDYYGPTVEGQDIEITGLDPALYCLSFVVNPGDRLMEAGNDVNNGASQLVDISGAPGGPRNVQLVGPGVADSSTCGLSAPVPDPDPDFTPDPDPPDPPDPGTGTGSDPGPGTGTSGGGTGGGTAPGGSNGGGGGSTGGGGGSAGGGGTPNTPAGMLSLSRAVSSSFALRAIKQAIAKPKSVLRSCAPSGTTARCAVTYKLGGASYVATLRLSQRLRAGAVYWYYALNAKRTRVGSCTRSRNCPRTVKTSWLLGGAVGANKVAAARALALRPGSPVRVTPGAAWSDSALTPSAKAQIRAYTPAGG